MKKRLICLIMSVLLLIPAVTPIVAAPAEDRVRLVIEAQWADAGDFHEELARVFDGSKWGYIGTDGKTVISCKWDIAADFHEGMAAVATVTKGVSGQTPDKQHWYLIDRTGKTVRDIGENNAYYFDTRVFLSGVSNGTYLTIPGGSGIISMGSVRGKTLPIRSFNSGCTYHDGYAIVSAAADGTMKRPQALQRLADILDQASMPDMLVDLDGKVTWDPDWGMILSVDNGCVVYHSISKGKWGIDTVDGKELVAPEITDLWYTYENGAYSGFSNGYATVCIGKQFYAVDQTGVKYPLPGDLVGQFGEGLLAYTSGGKYGYEDLNGKTVIKPAFSTGARFTNGVACVSNPDGYFYIDSTGAQLNAVKYEEAYTFSEAMGRVKINGKYGFVALVGRPANFSGDAPSRWAVTETSGAWDRGLVPTELDCLYTDNITRGEMTKLAVTLMMRLNNCSLEELILKKTGKTLSSFTATYPFTDTAERYVMAAYALGIIDGYTDHTFKPANSIARVEAAKILTVTAKLAGIKATSDPIRFADDSSINSWAKDYVAYVSATGIMVGIGNNLFSPNGKYSREQAFVTMYRIYSMAAAN